MAFYRFGRGSRYCRVPRMSQSSVTDSVSLSTRPFRNLDPAFATYYFRVGGINAASGELRDIGSARITAAGGAPVTPPHYGCL